MKGKFVLVFILAAVFLGVPAFAADTYAVDPVHSTIGFKVRHLGVSYVTGKFDKFEGNLIFDAEKLTSIKGAADVTSINTGDAKRDGHLQSDDFLSAEKFPAMTFKSTKITQTENNLAVTGDLTIRDVTKAVTLQGEFGGFVDMGKAKKTGLVLEGTINRKDFGLMFDKLLETGQLIVGDEVKISLELEAASENK